MYWSPIRTRLLVGMLTPAIRAKAVTPFADFCVADFCVVRLPYPPGMRGRGREGPGSYRPLPHCPHPIRPQRGRDGVQADPTSCSAPHKHKRDASLDPGPSVVEEFFDRVRSIYGLHRDPSTSPPTFLRPGAGFSTCGPVRFGRGSAAALDDDLYSRLGARLASPCGTRCGWRLGSLGFGLDRGLRRGLDRGLGACLATH